MSEDPEEWARLPLTEQFQHKNWKARKAGYEAAAKEFKTVQPSDPIVREFIIESSLWKTAVADSNVAAQQDALSAYNAFLDVAGAEGARKTRSVTIQGVVEKGLTGRPVAKASAIESLMLLIEVDKPDPVIEELLPFLSHKQPKIIAATLSALTGIYHAYGCKAVEPKPVIKLLPKVFGHADKNVRAEAQNLTVEFYRWLREAMKPLFWGELKDVQQKDLEKLFEPVKAEPQPKQERLLRSQQAAKEQAEEAGEVGEADAGEEDEEAGEIDLEPEYEAVDVLAKVPKDLNDRLASTKWKDRKDVLDEVFAAVNVPAMQDGSFDDIIRGCAKSMKDANIAVVAVAANCVECIAKGLRKSFTKYRGTILGAMLERFKEKKATVTDAISAACDAVFLATGLGEVSADVLEQLKSKNPQVKEQTAKFLIRSLKSAREAPSLEQTKEFAEGGKKLLTESVATLRDAGAEILGVLWKIMGDRNMLNQLEGLEELKKTKIKEFSDAAEVRAKWKPKVAAPAPKAALASATGRKPAPGTKRPAPKKAAPPRPNTPPEIMDDAPLQPRPTSRPAPAKGSAGLRPPGGLKAPGSGLQRPGTGLKAPAASSSPKRQLAPLEDISAPARATAGRGLAGRPLQAKPAAPSSPPPPTRQESAGSSALRDMERAELYDLREEVDLLRQQRMDLRGDKMRLTTQIAELQNQNAQLIEDHTRDVLLIKAKETQLVRARSDAESQEERGNSLGREVERLKREMSRLGRAAHASSPSVAEISAEYGRPAYGANRTYTAPPRHQYASDSGVYANSGDPATDGFGAEKENIPDYNDVLSPAAPNNADPNSGVIRTKAMPPPAHPSSYSQQQQQRHRPLSNGSSSAGLGAHTGSTPRDSHDSDGYKSRNISGGSSGAQSGIGAEGRQSQSEGVESWRRAAEVTQNLKARIEMMKARQNIGRGQ
ncbi:hypothetical protein LTR62_003182 [Meristemomyces frigidus]|uniref:TOG domain-containing protein n=1 Tax=Meristemomyces frigidus TaxID=1508187 RepID=A0AAN7TJ00_9PEZI|nr:hypothetical protein LTR62_003182 [Meristemomyces frigidus]